MDTNLQKYQAFVAAVELGGFSKAAERLNYSQSGISRMVADLEKEWGIVLLERDRGGVRLTSEGMRILPFARELCQVFASLENEVQQMNGCRRSSKNFKRIILALIMKCCLAIIRRFRNGSQKDGWTAAFCACRWIRSLRWKNWKGTS